MRLQSSLSSFNEAEASLFQEKRMSKVDEATLDLDKQLRADVKSMGTLLGKTIKHFAGEDIFDTVEKLRQAAKVCTNKCSISILSLTAFTDLILCMKKHPTSFIFSKAWREAGAGRDPSKKNACDSAFQSMAKLSTSLTSEELLVVSRAFTHFCAIANAAEYHHRSRRNQYDVRASALAGDTVGAFPSKPDSCGGVLPALMKRGDASAKEIYDSLVSQQVELVLTAHPTEVNRKTLLEKHRRVQLLLTQADEERLKGRPTPFQEAEINDKLEREIGLIWQSDELSRSKPTVQAEAERGTLVIETVLWEAIPNFMRKLDATMKCSLGEKYGLPLDAAPFKISSWMGGDRDGNPNVTPNVTREVCLRNRIRAATLIKADLADITGRLSTTFCNDEVRAKVGDVREPYRAVLYPMIDKLDLTIEWANQELKMLKGEPVSGSTVDIQDVYLSKQEVLNELFTIHKSLCDTGNALTAGGKVKNLIHKLCAFGLTLVPLDVRQESTRHTEALDAITRYLGQGELITLFVSFHSTYTSI